MARKSAAVLKSTPFGLVPAGARLAAVPRTLNSFRISPVLYSSFPLRFKSFGSGHRENLKRRGKEEQRKTRRVLPNQKVLMVSGASRGLRCR